MGRWRWPRTRELRQGNHIELCLCVGRGADATTAAICYDIGSILCDIDWSRCHKVSKTQTVSSSLFRLPVTRIATTQAAIKTRSAMYKLASQ